MYYYKISSYVPYDSHEDIVVAHKKFFDDYTLSVMVQDVIDKCVSEYAQIDKYDKRREPCRIAVDTHIFPNAIVHTLREMYGFELCPIAAKTSIEDGYLFHDDDIKQSFLFDRYNDLILGKCVECTRDKCVIKNKRRGD